MGLIYSQYNTNCCNKNYDYMNWKIYVNTNGICPICKQTIIPDDFMKLLKIAKKNCLQMGITNKEYLQLTHHFYDETSKKIISFT